MAVSVQQVVDAFGLLYESIHDPDFCKTLKLKENNERRLSPLVRTFLLGYFGYSLVPEAAAKLPGGLSGLGRIDFQIDNVAVEFAVRTPNADKAMLSDVVNAPEVKKLMKHDGLALLVLYDFSKGLFTEDDIDRFREWPSLGRGNHRKSPFNVAYFGRNKGETVCFRRNIRVGT